MSKIVIYNEDKMNLSEVGFIKDTLTQTKIRNINNSYELSKQIGIVFAVATNHLGIKQAIADITKTDIMEMITTRFKNLSINEVAYAFKMERYGGLGERTEHYQLFNSEYVSKVLMKYKDFKRQTKVIHEISVVAPKNVEASEEEKQFWINKGVNDCLDFFIENSFIEKGKLYIYDVLYDLDYLSKDTEYKKGIHKAAIECIETEQQLRETKSLADIKDKKEILRQIQIPKNGILINKCKELVLCQFFRLMLRDNDRLNKFRETFKQKNDVPNA